MKINGLNKARTHIEWVKIYPIIPDSDKLNNLKTKLAKKQVLMADKKAKGVKYTLGDKVGLHALKTSMAELEHPDPDLIKIIESKNIEKIRIKFNGSNQLRLVSLVRYRESWENYKL